MRNNFLEERKTGIGGSDIAAIMGLNKWKTALQVYLEKVENYQQEDNEYMQKGRLLEKAIAEMFILETNYKLEEIDKQIRSKELSFMIANIDRYIPYIDTGLEIKNLDAYHKKEFSKQNIPSEYILQCQHYMYVLEKKEWIFYALLGGNHTELFTIERDNEIIEEIKKAAINFWNNHIIKKIPPQVISNDVDLFQKIYSNSKENLIELSNSFSKELDQYIINSELIKNLEKQNDEIKAKIQFEMKENEQAICDKYSIKWKTQFSERIDIKKLKKDNIYQNYLKKISSRVFRIKNKNNE